MTSNDVRARSQQQSQSQNQADVVRQKWKEFLDKIVYSEKYTDDEYEYRHIILPKGLIRMCPKHFFADDETGCFRLLTEAEWRSIGIQQSLGWVHYEIHAPEPHVMLFRRRLDGDYPTNATAQVQQRQRDDHEQFGRRVAARK